MASLFDARQAVTETESDLASRAWSAYCSTDPRDILHLLDGDTLAMPFLLNALLLHLARFPSVFNGLGRIENEELELISDGAIKFKSLFPKFVRAEPVYGLGDSQLWNELKRLGAAREPLIAMSEGSDKSIGFHEAPLEMTANGREVLIGKRDFIEINGIDLWLGAFI